MDQDKREWDRENLMRDISEREPEKGSLFGWLVSKSPRQLLGYIADGPQDRASDNFTCCHT